MTGVREKYGLANTGTGLIKTWKNCQSMLTSVEYKTRADISCYGCWHFKALAHLYIFTHVLLDVFPASSEANTPVGASLSDLNHLMVVTDTVIVTVGPWAHICTPTSPT